MESMCFIWYNKGINMDYEIVPIFNQKKENIWSDFIRIAIVCNKQLGYNAKNGYNEKKILQNMSQNWDMKQYNFAFAAYHQNHMIGFAKGWLNKKCEMLFDNLYVLPEYQGMGIGSQLAKAVENAAVMVSDHIVLVAFIESMFFWIKKGYINTGLITMSKFLSLPRNTVVPVFQWNKDNFRFKMFVEDTVFAKNKNQPMFACFDDKGNIGGVAIQTKDGNKAIYINGGYNPYSEELLSVALMNVK